MPVFQFEAINPGGERQTGLLDAASRAIASQSLQQQQLTPLAITEFTQKLSPLRRIPIAAICGFYTKLADLIGSEVPLMQSLRITVDATTNPQLKEILKEVHSQVTDGRNLSAALSDHPRVFDSIAVSVIHAGLEGAFLDKALGELVQLYRRQQKVRSQVIGAVAYPAFLLCVGTAMLLSLLVFFVPQFAPMFDGLRERGQLPLMTDMLLAFSESFASNLLFVVVVTFGGVMMIIHWLRERNGSRKLLSLLMRFRFPGRLIGHLALARFSRLLSALLKNGVKAVSEGANMPTELDAAHEFLNAGILYAPAKAANAGGVAVSGLEQSQNALRLSWSHEEVDRKLQAIMQDIHGKCVEYGSKPGEPINYVEGANIAGFVKVADAMLAYGAV